MTINRPNILATISKFDLIPNWAKPTCWILVMIRPARPDLTAWGFTKHRVVLDPKSHLPTPGCSKKKLNSAAAVSGASEPWHAF